MKFLVLIGTICFFVLAVFSCKKEYSCEGCIENNKPPVAVAGPDTVITLPTDSILLDGKRSSDPDGKISGWLWTRVGGRASLTIATPANEKTVVKNLAVGSYQFELKVTDDKGASAKDTVMITVDAASTSNHPPIANAGTDQTITLPTNAVTLDGSGSPDPDNNITSYQWIKVSGPSSLGITNPGTAHTQVTNLVEGVYMFELKVTDAGGLFSKDTMQVTVNSTVVTTACDNSNRPQVPAQLIPIGILSQARIGMAVASSGNKILFAGGATMNVWGAADVKSSRVDIYDITTNTWSTAELCIGRYIIAAVASGNKIFFGGGEYGDGTWPVDSVDIYDVSTGTWRVSHLSTAGHSIAAAAVGNKVLFAGGDGGFNAFVGIDRSTQVDIYDLTTGTWSTASLSERKVLGHVAVTANNKVYIAGGETLQPDPNNPGYIRWYPSVKLDIYDNATNTWATSYLQEGKLNLAGIAEANKIYWAGGEAIGGTSCLVEIKDINTGNSTIEYLCKPAQWSSNGGQNAVVRNNKIIFYRPNETQDRNKFDIYDIGSGTWSVGVLNQPIPSGASIISANNVIYIAGGLVNDVMTNQVWKLEF